MVAMFKKQHFLHEAGTEFFAVGLEDLFDLFKLDGLDVGLLHVLSLYVQFHLFSRLVHF